MAELRWLYEEQRRRHDQGGVDQISKVPTCLALEY